ncbi:SUMF1/EgtB/PvdO family nonheme iron enzyme [Actibacterium sp. 188UL27-1]|uniref:formylglycine-generating enzyme family protein n=1 Tax=Actibacterium sp. 188UL27-1 TaxID=2786961 RepID=UPI0019574F2F|nr:SUMF1/EgtB/PvdO family nonheme iron enzyme [Actibacterium sp. 188UL27-1]MBM7067247.1 SUMF1/EgtB/PvdO family nonheme iron enzyme [Actibacterium sp. 188UL27-1]
MMRFAAFLVALCLVPATMATAQLLLPQPELRVLKDCETCPELVILPDGMYMSRAPVTLAEFRAFAEATNYVNRGWGCKWNRPHFPQEDNHPAVCLTYQGAVAYADWLTETTGQTYRLPKASELTYAVMGFEKTNYWWGQQIGRDRANCLGCGRPLDAVGTTAVDTYPPNPFNVLDAVGNVWIWTSDCKSAACEERVLMSGSWSSPPSDLRMTKRISNAPNVPFNTYGMRVVREQE